MNSMLEKLRQWHETQLFGFQKALQLDDYHMLWIAFADSNETRRLPYVMVIIQ